MDNLAVYWLLRNHEDIYLQINHDTLPADVETEVVPELKKYGIDYIEDAIGEGGYAGYNERLLDFGRSFSALRSDHQVKIGPYKDELCLGCPIGKHCTLRSQKIMDNERLRRVSDYFEERPKKDSNGGLFIVATVARTIDVLEKIAGNTMWKEWIKSCYGVSL